MGRGGRAYAAVGIGLLLALAAGAWVYASWPAVGSTGRSPLPSPLAGSSDSGGAEADWRSQEALLRRRLPSAPGVATAVMLTTDSALVSWGEPVDLGRGNFYGYGVSANGGAMVLSAQTSVVVGGLQSGVAYAFVVRAHGEVGWGPASAPSAVLTLPKIRPGLEGVVWTFDDCEYAALGNVYHILAVLQKHGVQPGHAIFFYIGWCYQQHPDEIAKIKQDGYEVGNHTYDHAWLTTLTYAGIQREIAGGPPNSYWFRPPYGAYNALVLKAVAAAGLHMMMWTVDSGDTSSYVPARTCAAELNLLWAKSVGGSDNVLMHMFHIESTQALDAYLSGSHTCSGYTG